MHLFYGVALGISVALMGWSQYLWWNETYRHPAWVPIAIAATIAGILSAMGAGRELAKYHRRIYEEGILL